MSAASPSFEGPLSVRSERSGTQTTVHVVGEIDLATIELLTEPVFALATPGTEVLVLELSGVTFCGSVGLAAFVAVDQHMRSIGGKVVLANPTAVVRRSLEITGLDRRIPVEGNDPTA